MAEHLVPNDTDYALCCVQKVLKWNNHFQKEQKNRSKRIKVRERGLYDFAEPQLSMDTHPFFIKIGRLWALRAFPNHVY